MMFFITLVRHAESTANRDNIIQGQSDTNLSQFGLEQARLVANRLKNERFTHVFSSDLTRAVCTAQTIVDNNLLCKCPVVKDKRLRERKFGVVEGKTYKELVIEARKENVALPFYTPHGAEKIEQLRERAKAFFNELCNSLLKKNVESSTSIKRHLDNDNGIMSISSVITNGLMDSDSDGKLENDAKRPRHEVEEDSKFYSCEVFTKEEARKAANANAKDSADHPDYSTPRDVFNKDPPVTDAEIKTSISCAKNSNSGCPNVSLSPLLEKRISSISSISSGRNNSFDEIDMGHSCIGDVLIVSHGGFLKEFIRHFIEDLHCKMPGGKSYALRVGPNTSMSKFTISFENGIDKPVITCLLIHDKDHLRNLDVRAPEIGLV